MGLSIKANEAAFDFVKPFYAARAIIYKIRRMIIERITIVHIISTFVKPYFLAGAFPIRGEMWENVGDGNGWG
jgi:hypothetical protein